MVAPLCRTAVYNVKLTKCCFAFFLPSPRLPDECPFQDPGSAPHSSRKHTSPHAVMQCNICLISSAIIRRHLICLSRRISSHERQTTNHRDSRSSGNLSAMQVTSAYTQATNVEQNMQNRQGVVRASLGCHGNRSHRASMACDSFAYILDPT